MDAKQNRGSRGSQLSSRTHSEHPNLPPSSAALLNIILPQASTSRGPEQPSTSKDGGSSWQQSMYDLEADERLARQMAEEEEAQFAMSQASKSKPRASEFEVDYDADARLARQLAQEEEDLYFSNNSQHTFNQQQNQITKSINGVKAKRFERKEYNPINYSNVVIHTKTSKKVAKQLAKKQQFKTLTTNNDTDTSDSLSAARRLKAKPEPRYPHVYDALLDAKFTVANLNNHKIYLPETSSRKSYSDYEEVTVKKMELVDLVPKDKLVSIAENFDAVGRVAFSTCSHLNPMQSVVYEAAYKSNKNLLVAAPTGSGKTNVAMMAVLNELRNYFKPGTTEMISGNISEKFKIIYIAPMKSLATEQTDNFSNRLKSLGIKTRELTGDMSMTEREIAQTHIIVTTPEKWDVVTRKSKGDIDLLSLVRLLIIDEVHLLQSDRGPVLEALVARTLRYVESSQRMTRIVGLSATLPNYVDVAKFLRVNPYEGLFYFDNRFRPVPLTQTFIGVRPLDSNSQSKTMDKICYNMVLQYVMQSKQVMIFVHARNSTQRVATKLREMIQLNNKIELFQPDLVSNPEAAKLMSSPKNKLLRDLFAIGFGIHHAGMIRHDRLLVEKLFRTGILKVLVCTATLAWGVNFPAHAVIIRGTEIYDASAGKFVDVGLLDVMQIFGRAGRPQYDSDGHAVIMTALEKMDSYLKLLTNQTPIESNFIKHLTDNLNAEVVSGTVSTVEEGMEWLRYTYLNVRITQNPLVYGCDHFEIESDPSLATIQKRLIEGAARQLDEARMCRFTPQNNQLEATDLGRIASHFYINYETITRYNEILSDHLEPQDILGLIGEAQEFQQIKYREEEANELDELRRACHLPIAGGVIETTKGKVSCLLQAYISRSYIESHSLISDLMYIAQNATRIGRGLFEYALKRGWPMTALNLLKMCKMLELRAWNFHSSFRHFDLPPQVIARLEETKCSIEQLETMTNAEIAKLVHFPDTMGATIKDLLKQLPYVTVDGHVKPVKSNLLVLNLTIQPYFKWNDRYHGNRSQSFWMWVVDEEITQQIYHSEHIKFNKEQVKKEQAQNFSINIPLVEDTLEDGSPGQCIPSEYIVFILSDAWIGCDYEFPIECLKITLPTQEVAYTKVPLNLYRLPLSTLQNELSATIFQCSQQELLITTQPFKHHQVAETSMHIEAFNTLQSQVFYPLYHCDRNLIISGPTSSGKTTLADIAILRVFNSKNTNPKRQKVVYITPMESLAQLKFRDWRQRISHNLQKQVDMLSDHNLFDDNLFTHTDILVACAEKFYVWLSRSGAQEDIRSVSLIIFDDLHLMSDKRGSSMELVIAQLSHLRSINGKIRFRQIGISNTVSNAQDLAAWLGGKKSGAYNFHPATARPVQLEIHVMGFPERHYSPRMSTMNKPIFRAILEHSPSQPVLIFVSSKKQCTLTSLELISCLVHHSQSQDKQWLHMDQSALNSLIGNIQDESLKLALEFGIGFLYHSLKISDKKTVEELYLYNKIQVLICTTNYVWESRLRAHLVVVKGTEHYDNERERFVDYPPADVMQMLGRAGRPDLDSTGIAILMIRDIYKEFYKKFLHEPFPVESNLLTLDETVLRNFLIAPKKADSPQGGTLKSDTTPDQKDTKQRGSALIEVKREAMNKISKTFLVRRLAKNPSYYGMNDGGSMESFLSRFLDASDFLYSEL